MLVRRWIPVAAAMAVVAGCGGGDEGAAASPTASLTVSSTPRPAATRTRPARPGTVCGHDRTVRGVRVTVVVVRGRVSCAEAMRIIRIYDDPDTRAEGAAALAVIDHWTCRTSSRARARRTGTVGTCTSKTAEIRTRAH